MKTQREIKRVVAKCVTTGLYFDGAAFNASKLNALQMSPLVTAEDFKLAWDAEILMEDADCDLHEVAKAYAINKRNCGQRHLVVLHNGRTSTRLIHIPAKSNAPCWAVFNGVKKALFMKNHYLTAE